MSDDRDSVALVAGEAITIAQIIPIDNTNCHIGFITQNPVKGWTSEFDGYDGYGTLWPISKIHRSFTQMNGLTKESKVIRGDFLFKKRNLKDLPCKIVFPIGNDYDVMVEFNEDIGGCSGDGQGKQGHCTVVDKRSLVKDKSSLIKKMKRKES